MASNRNFNFKWKLIENYVAVVVGGIFLWLFVNGMIKSDDTSIVASIIILAIAPFLITFVDKKSSGN